MGHERIPEPHFSGKVRVTVFVLTGPAFLAPEASDASTWIHDGLFFCVRAESGLLCSLLAFR